MSSPNLYHFMALARELASQLPRLNMTFDPAEVERLKNQMGQVREAMGQISQGAIEFATSAKILDNFGAVPFEIWENARRARFMEPIFAGKESLRNQTEGHWIFDPAGYEAPGYFPRDGRIPNLELLDKESEKRNQADTRIRVSAAQIHAELYAEVDTLLAEPDGFSEQAPTPSGRVNTLLKMGFFNQPEVSDFMSEDRRYQGRKIEYGFRRERYDLATRYAFRYSNYKFITHDSLDKVLSKYGLVKEGVGEFIGTIPDANVADMARFMEQVTIAEEDRVNGDSDNYLIAAPIDQFRPKGYKGFASKEAYDRWLIEDPIVLKQVRDGYLIITAWGDEASDPDVQNERNN